MVENRVKFKFAQMTNYGLLSGQVQVRLFSCHSQAISACDMHHLDFSSAAGN